MTREPRNRLAGRLLPEIMQAKEARHRHAVAGALARPPPTALPRSEHELPARLRRAELLDPAGCFGVLFRSRPEQQRGCRGSNNCSQVSIDHPTTG
jgi:hypothetical protein